MSAHLKTDARPTHWLSRYHGLTLEKSHPCGLSGILFRFSNTNCHQPTAIQYHPVVKQLT